MKKSTTTTTSDGNTNSSDVNDTHNTEKKKDKSFRKIYWTWNNYTIEDILLIKDYCTTRKHKYFFGEEIAPTTGTPHLQGYIEFNWPVKFSTLKKNFPKMHFKSPNGSREHNINYCSKYGETPKEKLHSNFPPSVKEIVLQTEYPEDIVWKPFQKQVLDILDLEPDRRKIFWFHEPTGNIGKSYLCKYLGLTRNIILADGKKNDVFNQVKTELDNDKIPNIIILDIPRTSHNYINYGVIENLKNGMIFSGKYEGGLCIFPIPHVIIFSNEPPDLSCLSKDRWCVHHINS